MTRKDRTTLLALLHSIAHLADRASDKVRGWGRNPIGELQDIIAKQERQHRRLAPAGHRHVWSVPQAVDYFVVKTLAEGWNAPETLLSKYVGVREDYIRAALLMCQDEFRREFVRLIEERYETPAEDVLKLFAAVDYCALSDSTRENDSETLAALAFARRFDK